MAHGDITHVDIPVRDMTSATSFYGSLFGWQINEIPGFEGYPMWQAPNKVSGGGLATREETFTQPRAYVEVDSIDEGLMVPVIRDADRKTAREIGAEARELGDRARAGRLTPDEFSGGTFTISNLGMFGISEFTAVINPPEAAILAVGASVETPVVKDGEVTVTTTMRLTLTVDHRVIDGATGAIFLRDLVRALEEPLRIVV